MNHNDYISFSRIRTKSRCDRQYYWSYVLGITPKFSADPLRLGTLVDDGITAAVVARWEAQKTSHPPQRVYQEGDGRVIESANTWAAQEHVKARYESDHEFRDNCQALVMKARSITKRAIDWVGLDTDRWTIETINGKAAAQVEINVDIGLGKPLYGFIDWIATDNEDGLRSVIDTKCIAILTDEETLMWDLQLPLYQIAINEQYGIKTDAITQFQIKSKVPTIPRMLKARSKKAGAKSPGLSTASNLGTDWTTYVEAAKVNGEDLGAERYDGMKDKMATFQKLVTIPRSAETLSTFLVEADGVINLIPENNYFSAYPMCLDPQRCNTCDFKELCQATLEVGDTKHLLDTMFMKKGGRPAKLIPTCEEDDGETT